MVHAVDPPATDVPMVPIGVTGWEQNLVMAAEVGLAHDASEIRQSGLAVQKRVVIGSVESVILEVATTEGADLIVMGTHGRKRGAHLFLGSVAESVVRSASVGTDGSVASQAALSWAGRFARSQACAVSIVRLYWPAEEAVRYGLNDPWDGPRRDEELLPLLERDLRRDTQGLVAQAPERLRLRANGEIRSARATRRPAGVCGRPILDRALPLGAAAPATVRGRRTLRTRGGAARGPVVAGTSGESPRRVERVFRPPHRMRGFPP